MIASNIGDAKIFMNKKAASLDTKAMRLRNKAMGQLIQLAKEEIVGKRGSHVGSRGGIVWDKATPDSPPKNRIGFLRNSITGFPTQTGFAQYEAVVGPTVIYSRRLEIGGGNWRAGTKFPYMQPAFDKFLTLQDGLVREIYGGE